MKKGIYILLVCAVSSLSAQDLGLYKFRNSFKNNIDELLEVYNFRGSSFVCDYGVNSEYEKIVFDFLHSWDSSAKRPILLFYSKSDDSLNTWLFTSSQMIYHSQKLSHGTLMDLESNLRKNIGAENLRGTRITSVSTEQDSWQTISKKLSDILFPSTLRKYFIGHSHLFVLPELNIGQIPFWLLSPYKNGSLLVDSMSYSLVPHVCKFTEFKANNSKLGQQRALHFLKPLVVGNPTYESAMGLSPLPGAQQEAEAVAQLLGCESLVQIEASIGVIREKMEFADLIYFATHASCSMDNILDSSWIAFTPMEFERGLLYLRQIQRMMLDCRLAVLSACQTGYGKVMEGGFVGLGRAFFKAGVDFTVMSLWSVNDEATSFLMQEFMKGTQELDYFQPAEPLRKAILKTREIYPHPAFWAPFVLFGFTY